METNKIKLQDLGTALFFIKNYKRYIAGIFFLSVLYAFFEGLNIAVLFPLIDSIFNIGTKTATSSAIIRFLNLLIGVIPVRDTFIAACVFIVIVVVLKNVIRYLNMVISANASYKIWEDIQKQLFVKYISADYRYFVEHKQGEIVYKVYGAPASIGSILKMVPQFLTEILKVVFISIMLFSMSLSVTCGTLFIACIFYFLTRGISRRVSYFLGKGRMEASEEQSILINEMISGIKQIKVFLSEKRWISNFCNAVEKYFKLSKKDILWTNMPVSALEIFALTTLSVVLIAMRKFSPQNLISNLPLLGVFAYAFQRIMPSLALITSLKMQIMGELPVLEVIHDVMNDEISRVKDGTKDLVSFREGIKFQDVSYAYPGRPEAVSGISITFEKNKCIAIVGPSGSGKTTIVNLIIRLFDPTRGKILVDENDLRYIRKDSWLSKIGFVSQDTFIFHASVRDNIAFGFDKASEEEILTAAKIANAHDFISRLPHGYDTIVGEKGMKLSGGEQQRLAIARAVLRKPQILIFDEATSALDNVSQSLIQGAINKIVKDHTVILIAHRLSTIVDADKIIVLESGKIKEIGSHEDLILKKGFYWGLYNNEKEFHSVI